MGDTLSTLIHSVLTNQLISGNYTEEEWQQCFDMALDQQVLAMTFPAMTALSKEQRPDFVLWSKWMAYAQNIAAQSKHKREVVRKMGGWLAEEGLSTMIIKGFSLAVLYPQPDLRVNIDGISVEHHFALHNSRVKNGMEGPTKVLLQLAATDRRPTSLPGICFPNPTFTALHTVWHAHKHFLSEKIELRHVIDWALALRQLSDEEARTVCEVKYGTPWGRFADTLTDIALHRLQLPTDWFPQREVEAALEISPELEQRVWADIMGSGHTAHGRTSNPRRLNIARRMLQNRWKFAAYADISAERFLWKEFVGYVRNRKA